MFYYEFLFNIYYIIYQLLIYIFFGSVKILKNIIIYTFNEAINLVR